MKTHLSLTMSNTNHFKELVIPPTMLGIITTDKCTAACKNCCFKCNPQNNKRLSVNTIKKNIDSATKNFNTIKTLVLTGGECFTLGKDLYKIIEYSAKKVL